MPVRVQCERSSRHHLGVMRQIVPAYESDAARRAVPGARPQRVRSPPTPSQLAGVGGRHLFVEVGEHCGPGVFVPGYGLLVVEPGVSQEGQVGPGAGGPEDTRLGRNSPESGDKASASDHDDPRRRTPGHHAAGGRHIRGLPRTMRLLAVSSGFGRVGPAWRVDGGKIVSLTV